MATLNAHGPESGRIHRIVRNLADARERASMARMTGDYSGESYARAEVRRLSRILAEG